MSRPTYNTIVYGLKDVIKVSVKTKNCSIICSKYQLLYTRILSIISFSYKENRAHFCQCRLFQKLCHKLNLISSDISVSVDHFPHNSTLSQYRTDQTSLRLLRVYHIEHCHFADANVLTSCNNAHNLHLGLCRRHSSMNHPRLALYQEISIPQCWIVYPVQGKVDTGWELHLS